MVPFLGPNTTRSLVGNAIGLVLNPLSLLESGEAIDAYNAARTPVAAVSFRANIFEAFNDIKYNSLDPYARTRSFYFQSQGGGARPGPEEQESASDDEFDAFFEEIDQ